MLSLKFSGGKYAWVVILEGLYNSSLGWNKLIGSCPKCPFKVDTFTACPRVLWKLLLSWDPEGNGNVTYLHLFNQSTDELEKSVTCIYFILILKQHLKRSGPFVYSQKCYQISRSTNKHSSKHLYTLSSMDIVLLLVLSTVSPLKGWLDKTHRLIWELAGPMNSSHSLFYSDSSTQVSTSTELEEILSSEILAGAFNYSYRTEWLTSSRQHSYLTCLLTKICKLRKGLHWKSFLNKQK